jgi:outer membrane beta-barrel protein
VLKTTAQPILVAILLGLISVSAPALAETAPEESAVDLSASDEDDEDADGVEDDAATTDADAKGLAQLRESIRVIQQRPVLRRMRLELQVQTGLGLADVMFRNQLVSGNLRFHLAENWSIAGSYIHYFSRKTSLHETVAEDYELFPETSLHRWFAGGDLSWSPIYGKFNFFGKGIVQFDISLIVGAGVTVTSRSTDLKPTGVVGLGLRIFITRWLAFTSEFRDHIFVEDFNAGNELVNHVIYQGGFSIFFPFKNKYRFAR